jgi:hypothetical protein
MDETYVVNQMKEDVCYVSSNFNEDMKIARWVRKCSLFFIFYYSVINCHARDWHKMFVHVYVQEQMNLALSSRYQKCWCCICLFIVWCGLKTYKPNLKFLL